MRFLLEETFEEVNEINREVLLEKLESMFSTTKLELEMAVSCTNSVCFRVNVTNPLRYGNDIYYGYALCFSSMLVINLSEQSTFEVLNTTYEKFQIIDREKLVVL